MRVPRQALTVVRNGSFTGVFAIADPLPRSVSRSYTNYARLVMLSFGFQKAFQRGFQADDEVFFTRVSRFFTQARFVRRR